MNRLEFLGKRCILFFRQTKALFIRIAFFKLYDIVHHLWNLINDNFARCIPRLHIGMKLSPIKFLDPIHVERIFRKCNIDSGLIVKEVDVVHCSLFS